MARNLDHLAYSENLYDFMKSLIPFAITTTNKSVNKHMLNGEAGLEKNEFLNIYYNDPIGKREVIQELMLSCCLPKEWGSSDDPKQIDEGQELGCILIDIQGSFSVYKFVQKLRAFYESNDLVEGSKPEGGWASAEARQKMVSDDKHAFIRTVLGNLYVFNCMDAVEFNLTVRSLANFLKTHKSIGMVVIDGLHYIENLDSLFKRERVHLNEEGRKTDEAKKGANVQAFAEEMGDDVPSIDDFFGDAAAKEDNPNLFASAGNQRKSLLLSTTGKGKKGTGGTDSKAFDQKLVDRALQLLLDY